MSTSPPEMPETAPRPGPEIDPAPAPVEMPASPPVSIPPMPDAAPPVIGKAIAGSGRRHLWLALAVPWLGATAMAAAPVDVADRRFMDDAATGGMVEIVFGRLAVEKAQAEPVRQFGSHMVDDHIKANEALKAIAVAKGVQLPTGLSTEEKANASHLKKLKGAAFDRQYLARMLADHQKSVALFSRASAAATDPDVKQFAAAQLPTVQSHLGMLRQIAATPAAPAKRGTAARE